MPKILRLVFSSGSGNSIFLEIVFFNLANPQVQVSYLITTWAMDMCTFNLRDKKVPIHLSILPGLMRAGSRVSILLVAMITWNKECHKMHRYL